MTNTPKRSKGKSGRAARANVADYAAQEVWTDVDKAELAQLLEREALLPEDAPRALLSVRLSVLSADTTSPVRTELDLRKKALDDGCRVVGVAKDLNVSATKVPPWKRKALGDWINNRVPEWDVLYFWKIDRFIRNIGDLQKMIDWVKKYSKNLVSLNDPINLKLNDPVIEAMLGFVAAFAQIETANTGLRVSSLWDYTKRNDEWHIGKPPYGYRVTEGEGGKNTLAHMDDEVACLRFLWDKIVTEGQSLTAACRAAAEEGLLDRVPTGNTMIRRLRNPALMGYRVEENKDSWQERSKLVYDTEGQPIRVGPEIFTDEEFHALQEALDGRRKKSPERQRESPTQFLGVLKCAQCESNMTVRVYRRGEFGEYAYLICRNCPNGGHAVPDPQGIYDKFAEQILALLGDYPVETREYARGAAVRAEVKRLQETIKHYMKELEPGGQYTANRFVHDQALATQASLIAQLEAIDPSEMEDRWVSRADGKTYAEHWAEGGMDAMTEDLNRAGITCIVERVKIAPRKPPKVTMHLDIPENVRKRLEIRPDEFADVF